MCPGISMADWEEREERDVLFGSGVYGTSDRSRRQRLSKSGDLTGQRAVVLGM
jgi:hypothetical protein